MALDPSIPLQAGRGVAPIDPLGTITRVAGLGNQLAGMAQTQQNVLNLRASAAANADAQKAVDPVTGRFDPMKYNQIMAADPNAARAAQASMQSAQTLQIAQRQAQQVQIQNGMTRLGAVASAAQGLLASGQPLTPKAVMGEIANLVATHVLPASIAVNLIKNVQAVPQDKLRSVVQALGAQAANGATALAPRIVPVDTGTGSMLVNENQAYGSGVGPVANVSRGAPSSQLATPTPVIQPNGQPGVVPLGGLRGEPGLPPRGGVYTPAPGAQGVPQAPPPQPAPVSQGQPPPAPVGAPAQPQGGMPRDFTATGLAPGQAEAMAEQQKGSAQAEVSFQNTLSTLPQQRANLQQLLSQVNSANPGPLASQFAKLGGIISQLTGSTGDEASAKQLMDKNYSLLIQSTSQAMGAITDSKMAMLAEGTPNSNMTKLATQTAGAEILGAMDYITAKGAAWQQYQQQAGPTANYFAFQNQWNQSVPNASVFQFNRLPVSERAKYWRSLSKPDKEQFLKSAEAAGVVPDATGK